MDRRQRSVTARDPERVRVGGAREPGRVLAVAEDVRLDPERLRLLRPDPRDWVARSPSVD
jgi:hypothetical protein